MGVREQLNEYKKELEVSTDREFAEKIGATKGNVDSWVKRNKIPDKWILIIEKMINSGTKIGQKDSLSVSLVTAGAGTGVYNFDTQETLLSLNPKLFPSLVGHHITAVQIDGDSMEPTLRQGDYILITPPTADRQTEDGIYAIRIDGMIKVKSLQFLMDGTIKIISDNPKYSPEIYDPKTSQIDFEILGKQRLTISR